MVEDPKTIGELLRRKRVDMGLTNAQVVHSLGICYQGVERYEHGRCPMKPEHRVKVVASLGYDPEVACPKPRPDERARNL